jgi:hypothetical protein
MDIQKMYDDSRRSFDVKDMESLEKKLRLYVNGGFQGLRDIYYNYRQEQKIKFSEIIPFETFINTSDIERFYLDEVFFEVDNPYLTNIGCGIKSLCHYYSNSEKSTENKKIDLISVVARLEEAINKSSISQSSENTKLYDILKRIENYYSIIYNNLYNDFSPLLIDRPQLNKNLESTTNILGQETKTPIIKKTTLDRSEITDKLIGLNTKKYDKFLEYEKKLISQSYLNSHRNKWLSGTANFIRFYTHCENKSIIKNDIYRDNAKGVKLLRNLYNYYDGDLDPPSKRKKQMNKTNKSEFNFLDII